jgi:hypothetical protein
MKRLHAGGARSLIVLIASALKVFAIGRPRTRDEF